jgi:hypothetical protein
MADFYGALKKGIEAFHAADQARKEADGVVAVLSAELEESTRGKIAEVKILERSRAAGSPRGGTVPSLVAAMMGEAELITYLAVVAFAAPDEGGTRDFVELCRVQFSDKGYPVKITLDGRDMSCHDLPSFEAALVTVLSSRSVGEKLFPFLRRTP